MGARAADIAGVLEAAEAYARALHEADAAALAEIFHPAACLYASQEGGLIEWPRQTFLDRVAARAPGAGAADYAIHAIEVAGPETVNLQLSVAVPPRRFTDHLQFLKIDGAWRIISKTFRVAEGPAV